MNIKNLFKFVLVWVALAGVLPVMAQFKDVKIDFTNDKVMTYSNILSIIIRYCHGIAVNAHKRMSKYSPSVMNQRAILALFI